MQRLQLKCRNKSTHIINLYLAETIIFFTIIFSKFLKDMLNNLYYILEGIFVKFALFWDCHSAFHNFRVFCCKFYLNGFGLIWASFFI